MSINKHMLQGEPLLYDIDRMIRILELVEQKVIDEKFISEEAFINLYAAKAELMKILKEYEK